MAKVSIAFDIDEKVAEILDRSCERLGPPKYKVVEAAIQAFSALPMVYQYILKSSNEADRKLCLDLIGALEAPLRRDVHGGKKKPSKAG